MTIAMIRKERKLTQKEVADAAQIDRTTYTNIETGKARPSIKTAMRIAKVLDISWTVFFEAEGEEHDD